MERQKSILRTGGAAQAERRTNSVHYPRDSQLLSIVPPSGGSNSRFRTEIQHTGSVPGASVAAAGEHGSSGSGSSHDGATVGGTENESGFGGAAVEGTENESVLLRITSGRLRALLDDPGSLSDDSTPLSQTIQEQLDLSIVLGPLQNNDVFDDDDEDDGPSNSVPNPILRRPTMEQKRKSRAPEQRITIFAFRLALIEKAASGLGTIAFLWATVVILGGFASTIVLTDFLVVTVIILAETSRIFSRSHELEWQHVSSKSSGGLGLGSRFINAARSISGQREESKHGGKRFQPSRTISAPARLLGNRSLFGRTPKTPSPSPDSELITPTNSSSTSSRHKRKLEQTLPTTAPKAPRRPQLARSEPLQAQRRERTWDLLNVPLLPFAKSWSTTQVVSRVLYFAQIFSAVVTLGLSLWRLSIQKFANPSADNVTVSMNVFYVLAVLEAGLFLLEKVYWEFRIKYRELLKEVCEEDHVGAENREVVNQFFYDVYAESLKGSVFDGLEMDLVKYCINWLQTEDFKQQLGGARLLNRFVSQNRKLRQDRFAHDALRRLGTTTGIIERLVEMLSWGSKHEEELLMEVSTIICRLVRYNRNCARIVAVPGALDGIVALLTRDNDILGRDPYFLRLMGLRILKYLCKDHKNSLKIGETRGLLSILMLFIEVRAGKDSFESNDAHQSVTLQFHLKSYKKSLQVLFLLASATNTSGGILRKRIAAIVSGLKNLRDIIQYGKKRPELQWLAIEILNHLAMEDDVRKMIGATGGVIRNLFKLFRKCGKFERSLSEGAETGQAKAIRGKRQLASEKAGETLTRLVLQNEKNGLRLLELKDKKMENKLVRVMVGALSKDEKIASSAASILRSVMKYADDTTKIEIATMTETVVAENIFGRRGRDTKSGMYEASMGLAARTVESLDETRYREILNTVDKVDFVRQLIRNLHHTPTTNKYPRIRRYTLEMIIALIEKDNEFLDTFKRHNLNLKGVLEITLDSTSEVENFCLFSGLVGYTRHLEDIDHLIERAIKAVENYHRTCSYSRRDHEDYLS